jgi:hypothetical protein
MIHNSPKTTAIRQRMEEVRCDLDEDVQEIVEEARDMGQWRYYVRTYPWVCVGAALAAGYLIVPRRPGGEQTAQTSAEITKQNLATSHVSPAGDARGMLLRFLGNLVMRGVSSYVEQQAGKLFAPWADKSPQAARSPQDDNHEEPHS